MVDKDTLITKLGRVLDRLRAAERPPAHAALALLLARLAEILEAEPQDLRPRDAAGMPGGLVRLADRLPTAVLPDVHARPGLIATALAHEVVPRHSLLEALVSGAAQLVCVGDYFHGEARVRRRWAAAQREYEGGFQDHEAMDAEMSESFVVLMMLAALKLSAPRAVHLLKGNHENVANESGFGNHPFVKFANEGAMVAAYVNSFYGPDLLGAVYRVEKGLPILAVGPFYLIGHAEPGRLFTREEVIGYRDRAEVIHGMTWTDNDEAEPGAVGRMLRHYLPPEAADEGRYFGGHRPVSGRFALRAEGRYVQIHNPERYIMAILPPDRAPEPELDVVDLGPNKDAVDDAAAG